MSSQEGDATTPPPPPPRRQIEHTDLMSMKTFKAVNVISALTILTTLIIVAIPIPSLRVERQIDVVDVNLNHAIISNVVGVTSKPYKSDGRAIYLSTQFDYNRLGNVTVGNVNIPVSDHCKDRFVALYYPTTPLTRPEFLNIYDFFVGGVTITKFSQSATDPTHYWPLDAAIYLLPHSSTLPSKLEAALYDVLYGDVAHFFVTSFVDSAGKFVYDVKVPLHASQVEIRIGNEVVRCSDPRAKLRIRTVEVAKHHIAKVTAVGADPGSHDEIYVSTDDWAKAYVGAEGLQQLLTDKNIQLDPNDDLFAIKPVVFTDRELVPVQLKQELSPLLYFHNTVVEGWKYNVVFADAWHLVGDVTVDSSTIPSDPTATERVFLVFQKPQEGSHFYGVVCTRHGGTNSCTQFAAGVAPPSST
ncbi:transcriptional regulator [Babesia caballi]|uniref:Transcriptional regulator n=1 Tax=Babesia caballi TaxID=5871 RepID=A0AAV4LYD1_BABCB|nr:transcriptional regulator [Babesia caballi]